MDINVKIGLDQDTKEIAWAFLNNMTVLTKPVIDKDTKKSKAPEEVNEPEMAEVVAELEDKVEEVDHAALRKEIKQLGVKLVHAKKQKEVKELTKKYGYTKIDELPDDKLESYLEELKEI